MVTQTITCYHCEGENIVRNGKAPKTANRSTSARIVVGKVARIPALMLTSPQRREEILRA